MLANKTDYDCGPIAVINAIYLVSHTLLSYEAIVKYLKTDQYGTDDDIMNDTLNIFAETMDYRVILFKHPERNLSKIKDILTFQESAAILGHVDHYGEWHYSTWDCKSGSSVRSHNLIFGCTEPTVEFSDFDLFENLCKKTKGGEKPWLWLLVDARDFDED